MFEPENEQADWIEEYEGQLALDAYQTDEEVIIKAPIAGVKPEELEVSITDDVVTIKGQRKQEHEVKKDNYIAQECYWGSFSRSISLPPGCHSEKSKAGLKNGVLTITIPKKPDKKTKKLNIETE
ncbi:MAG: Hsp20/alpha crystallin family protein [Patescibacteria group bacterium]|nr:Hsp20/alpha crystallin family protein [Patescibacteria group bacterium]